MIIMRSICSFNRIVKSNVHVHNLNLEEKDTGGCRHLLVSVPVYMVGKVTIDV